MPFQKGQSGNPKGRGLDKPWREALRRAVARLTENGGVAEGLDLIASEVVSMARAGDKDCWKEVGDRLDGKSIQQSESTVDVNVTHHDAKQRLGRKLHSIAVPGTEAAPTELTH